MKCNRYNKLPEYLFSSLRREVDAGDGHRVSIVDTKIKSYIRHRVNLNPPSLNLLLSNSEI